MAVLLMLGSAEASEAFALAADVIKQVISLSTGVLVLIVTFTGAGKRRVTPKIRRGVAVSAGMFLVSIIAGLLGLLALTGQLAQGGGIDEPNVRLFSGAQIVLFVAAMIATIRVGWLGLESPAAEDDEEQESEPEKAANEKTSGDG